MHADPSVVGQRGGPRQYLRHPQQTVAEQLQQGAGMRSVLLTGLWTLLSSKLLVGVCMTSLY